MKMRAKYLKIFMAIFAFDERLPTSATLLFFKTVGLWSFVNVGL